MFRAYDNDLKEEFFVFTSDYCELQDLLQYEEPIASAYSDRNGWRYYVYKIQNVYITTGYARPRGCGLAIPPELREEYTIKLKESKERGDWEYQKALFDFAQKLRDYTIEEKSRNEEKK